MTSGLIAHFRLLGGYNRLANERLYAACAELGDAALRQDRVARAIAFVSVLPDPVRWSGLEATT